MERRFNYNYAQINVVNIVVGVSAMWEQTTEDHPLYNRMIPIKEYDNALIGQRYIGRDEDGYGIFEPVEKEPTEEEQTGAEQTEEATE